MFPTLRLLAVTAVVTTTLGASAACAASFSCEAKLTAFGKIICASDELSALEGRVTDSYHKALEGLSEPAAATVRAGQAEWITFVRNACGDDKDMGKLPETPDQDVTSCFTSQFQSRLETLEANRSVGGVRIYSYDRFNVVPRAGEDAEWGPGVSAHDLSIAQIDGAGDAFNGKLVEMFAGDIAKRLASTEQDDTLTVRAEPRASGNTTFVSDDYFFSYGAHGGTMKTYHHYLAGKKRFLAATDVFAGPKWRKLLPAIAARKLKAADYSMFEADSSEFLAAVTAADRWTFGPEGLEIQFQQYEVASYAEGLPTVTVPWKEIGAMLAPGFKVDAWR